MQKFSQKITIFFTFLFLFTLYPSLFSQEITVTGEWSLAVDELDLTSGPGSDFGGTYESAANQLEIDIKGKKTTDWRVLVRKIDGNWYSGFILSVRITDTGSGPGSLIGGQTYQIITDSDQEFFRGGKNRNNIEAQLRVQGVTVSASPDVYTTTVYYTVEAL